MWDYGLRRVSLFDQGGEHLYHQLLPTVSGRRPASPYFDGWLAELESGQDLDAAPAMGALVLLASDGEIVDTIVGPYSIPETKYEEISPGILGLVVPPVFEVYPQWTIIGDDVIWTDAYDRAVWQIDSIRNRTLTDSLDRTTRQVSDADQEAHFNWYSRTFGQEVSEADRQAFRFAGNTPIVTRVLADDCRVWFADFDPSGNVLHGWVGSTWEVWDRCSDHKFVVSVPMGIELVAVRGSRMLGVFQNEDNVQKIAYLSW